MVSQSIAPTPIYTKYPTLSDIPLSTVAGYMFPDGGATTSLSPAPRPAAASVFDVLNKDLSPLV